MASTIGKETKEQIVQYLKEHPYYLRNDYKVVADMFGATKDIIKHITRSVRDEFPKLDPKPDKSDVRRTRPLPGTDVVIEKLEIQEPKRIRGSETTFTEKENGEAEYNFITSKQIKSKDDLITAADIDLSKWEITRYVVNKWDVGAKNAASVIEVTPLFQVKLWLAPLADKEEVITEAWEDFIRNYEFKYTPVKKEDVIINDAFDRPVSLLISMADFHLEKRTVDGKTMDEKVELFKRVVDNIVYKAYKSHFIDEIVYVTSNDFLHVDNYQESTTKLTPQQSSTTWYSSYEVGFDLQALVIQKLKQFCNKLTVVHVPSNHARCKEYYLVHGLSVLFRNDENIVFNRTAEPTKCYTYGTNFIGMHHGDVKSFAQLPTYFASKYREQWGASKYTEIALADRHHRKEWKQALTKDEVHGTRMFIAPSLSGADIWHTDSLYDLAIQASIGRLYDKEKGYCGEIEERI